MRALVVVCLLGLLLPLPWYLHLQQSYSDPIFGRGSLPAPAVSRGLGPGRSAAPAPFRLAAAAPVTWRDSRFYLDPGLPGVVTAPHRRGLPPAFWPILYDDFWGDYFGTWAWGSTQKELSASVEDRLTVQSVVGAVPTFLVAAGLLAVALLAVVRLRSRPELLLVPLLGLTALAGMIYYAHTHPATDGDTVKGLFILPAVPALAICFGFAVETLARRSRALRLRPRRAARRLPRHLARFRNRVTAGGDPREWRFLRLSLAVVALVAVVDAGAWKLHDLAHPPPSRLESSVNCLRQNGLSPVTPAVDPLARSAGEGSFQVVAEGNGVAVALASSDAQAKRIERYYHDVAGELKGRLERRELTVYLWQGIATPTQRQRLYDCQY